MAAAVVPGEETVAANGANAADGIADNYSVGLMYSGFGLKAGIGYENLQRAGAGSGWGNGDDQEMIQAGASYTFNNFSVGAQYRK